LETYRKTDKLPDVAIITLPFNSLGGEAILGNYIDLLKPLVNEIYVITGKFPDPPGKKIHVTRIMVEIGKRELMLIKIPRFLITQLKISYHLFKISRNIDMVIFQIGTRLYLITLLLAKLLQKKVVIVATGRQSICAKVELVKTPWHIIFPFIFRIIEDINFTLADHIAVLSKSGIELGGLNRYRKKITISGAQYIDTNTWKVKKKLEERSNIIGYIGDLGPRKGVLNFIEAIPLVLKEVNDVEFVIGGSGVLIHTIQEKLEKNLDHKVKLIGWIPQEKLPDQLNELKLFILPSYLEGLPATTQQAMACGTVALATPVGGIPDLIKDEETGFILQNNSPECIAKTIIRALEHPKLAEISENAHQLIEREYNYYSSMKNCEKTLRSALSRN